jgi:glycosyltransferase involved in cell wall biosynthesis
VESRRTIVVCGAGYVSGKEIVAIELARGLINAGHLPYVLVSSWNNGDFLARLENVRLPYELMPLGFIAARLDAKNVKMTAEQLLNWPRLIRSYRKMLKRERPTSIIHTNWHHLLLLWPFLNPARDFFWVHEVFPDTPRYRHFFSRLSRRLAKLICVSNAVADSLKQLGVHPHKVSVIHNGLVDPADYALKNWQDRPDTLRVGIVGQIGEWKGHLDLFEATALARRNQCNLHLAVYGQGDELFISQLKKTATNLGIFECVSWHGFERDRARIYNQLDVCVVPSRSHDPLPTTAIEAAFFGLPVIATLRGGLPEIVEDGETGFLVDAESPTQIADALVKFARQPDLCERMGQAARKCAVERFSRGRFIADFLHQIDRTAASPRDVGGV